MVAKMQGHKLCLRNLGALIKEERKKRGLTQDELGRASGSSQATVQRLEIGFGGTRIEILLEICAVLDVSLSGLLDQAVGAGRKHQQVSDSLSMGAVSPFEKKWLQNILGEIEKNPWKKIANKKQNS